jgi:glycosyltransferase involved in cell wall biosynthesis
VVNEKLLASFALLHPSKREGYGLASIEAAYLGTPSLLINYSNNATVDLQISPKLLVREDVPIKIAERLYFAYNNQDSLRAEVLEWARVASIEKSWRNTLEDIERLAANKK